jgi:dUTP pyrophosphatase
MNTLQVKLAHPNARVPTRMTEGAAGYDLYSVENVVIPPRGIGKVNTGVCITVPKGTYGRIAPRSGLALKGLDVGAGVVDRDFGGCICVILYNHSDNSFTVEEGQRIAQLIIESILTPDIEVVESLKETARGSGGYGSTGL